MLSICKVIQYNNKTNQRWGIISIISVAVAVVLFYMVSLQASSQNLEAVKYFENHIRPLLLNSCIECHGSKKAESGLRLDNIKSILKGGDSGPAIVPGQAKNSLVIKAIRHEGDYEMPPDKKLDDIKIEVLTHWIDKGAIWPEGVTLGKKGLSLRSGPVTQAEREFWSFQPLKNISLIKNPDDSWSINDIDRFIIATLNEKGLSPRTKADKWTLIRRATYDLTGLPPTPEEIQSFINDKTPNAFSKVINRLLESNSYGERWGRHWLDVVRYADTAGETADYPTPLSWKYRNWVINAFNKDKPYDEFIREQIAGDIIAKQQPEISHDQYKDLHIATGFIAISRRFGFDSENYHNLTIQDTIDTLGQSVLGLTLGCARCHDHKFDPINKNDYYSWYGIFESTKYSFPGSEEKKRPYDLIPVLPASESKKLKAEYDSQLALLVTEIEAIKKAQTSKKKIASDKALKNNIKQNPTQSTEDESKSKRLLELTEKLNKLKAVGPYEMIYGAVEKENPGNAKIQIRGNKLKLGDEVPRRNLEVLGGELVQTNSGSGRWNLAQWMTSPENSLTKRVIVNRIWQYHFGRGLVGTENDFGTRGKRPTHPELLDWLAVKFQKSSWSMKSLHRLIMNTATYQQSSEFDELSNKLDPEMKYLWRFPRRRLSAEEIRDSLLIISGDLDPTEGEAHPFPAVEQWNFTQHNPFYGVYETKRRSIYLMQQRLKTHPFLSLFDGADPNVSSPNRILTTVPTQTLYLMNSPFMHVRSLSLAKKLILKNKDKETRIRHAWIAILSRYPTEDEVNKGIQFLSEYQKKLLEIKMPQEKLELSAFACLIRTLFTRNEFLFIN